MQHFRRVSFVLASLALLVVSSARAGDPPAPGAYAYIVSPSHGEVVQSPVKVIFGLAGMGVSPAGVRVPYTGHHHLLINTGLPSLDLPIPSDANHRHFGAGQTEVLVELPPGEHTLMLLLGDYTHIPHNPPVKSETIRITVK